MSSANPLTTAEKSAPSPLGCSVCSKIVRVLTTPFSEKIKVVLGKVHDILAHECEHTEWLRDIKYGQVKVPRYESRELILWKSLNRRNAHFKVSYIEEEGIQQANTPGCELVFRPGVPNHEGTARILDKKWIDMDLVKDWTSRCFEEHGTQCDVSTFQSIRPFYPRWLIDVGRGCVVACPENGPPFATLSYTWGRTTHFRTTRANIDQVQQPGALLYGSIATQIPQTIHDSIQLTKALGLAWLWVDSLCIVQDDEAAFSHQLRNMHHIYATSVLTILAKDGQDAGYGLRGLRGISAPRSIEQVVLPLAGGETIVMMEPGYKPRLVSMFEYEERMWTFQEEVFAKRRLIFERGRVAWQCGCASWHEHQPYHAEADIATGRGRITYEKLEKNPPNLNKLSQIVRNFNMRNLSFDEDIHNAFSGLQTYLNNIFPSGLVLGHPELFFEISLCWYAGPNMRRRKVSEAYTGDPVRNRLPSWSWMGWQGRFQFPEDQEHVPSPGWPGEGFTQAVTQWHVLPRPDSTTKHPIDCMWHQYREGIPDEIPEGWRREEFKPPLEWAPDHYYGEIRFDSPGCMPKDLPAHTYIQASKEEHPSASRWYPVPVGDLNMTSEDEELNSHRDFQYLQCLTTRAYLYGSPDDAQCVKWDLDALIKDSNGNLVGGLQVHHEDDQTFLASGPMIELIAVVKGWTTKLKEYVFHVELEQRPPLRNFHQLTLEEEEEEIRDFAEMVKRKETQSSPWEEKWEFERSKKQDCYHVLWIEWERGVAYRRGSGFVLADRWEELAEVDKVEVTLG